MHGGRVTATGVAALALEVAERNSSGAHTMERRGFSWIELPGEAATPRKEGRQGKGRIHMHLLHGPQAQGV
jgi:hypothetical protein